MMDVMTRCPLQVPNMHNMGPKYVWASSISFEKRGIGPRADKGRKKR
jgi:hypothetical protein